jgi:Translationally controlled tumour protein
LEGANPSAEGEDGDEGGEGGEAKKILDIEDQFRLNKIEGGMDKKALTADLKGALRS